MGGITPLHWKPFGTSGAIVEGFVPLDDIGGYSRALSTMMSGSAGGALGGGVGGERAGGRTAVQPF